MPIYRYTFLVALIILSVLGLRAVEAPNKTAEKPFTIVLDAGHGGKDAGACDNNVKEKDINLGVALELGKLIEKKMKDAKVVYTRSTDTYLTLQERADKANAAKGDLFISIHTNSIDKSNPKRTSIAGSSVYALGLHKDKNNMDVAMRENSVIELEKNFEEKYSGFDPQRDESYIIFEMAQKKTLSKSIKFAEEAQKQLVAEAGRGDRGVHQAGFWVLWATSMPAVLVELDFICNPNSAKFIASEQGEKKLAEALFKAIQNYRKPGKKIEVTKEVTVVDEEPTDDGSKTVVLAATTVTHERIDTPDVKTNQNNSGGQRRRRSAASRQASEKRVVEAESILIAVEEAPIIVEEDAPAVAEVSPKPASEPTEASARNNKRKADRDAAKQQKDVAASGAKTTSKKSDKNLNNSRMVRHSARNDRFRTVYKIQILASPKQLKTNDPEFCGLTPVKSFKDNNLYKYTYGESEERAEIDRMLKVVKEKIPEAFVIKTLMPL